MGICQSKEEKIRGERTKEIDKQLKMAQVAGQRTMKLLLLGTGECGKSTVLKQMRLLHNKNFSDEELIQQRNIVYNNTVHAMDDILRAMTASAKPFSILDRERDARIIREVIKNNRESEPFTPEVRSALKLLWRDPAVQQTYTEKRLVYHFQDSAKFFLDNVERIAEREYMPTAQDVLLTRIKTTGIVEVSFIIKNVNFRIFDVGGQRSERKKWIHCFEDVNAVIFITAISEYDEVLKEDEATNRLIESARLFESISNSRWFTSTSMILFLNKKDIFAEKLSFSPLTAAFPTYKGSQEYDECVKFIKTNFEKLNNNAQKTIYTHETCATDTDQVQKILDSVISNIVQQNLQKTGLY